MKKLIATAMLTSALMCACTSADPGIPLLSDFDTPHQTPPFEKIRLEHFMPAFEEGIARSRAEIGTIVKNPDEPTFANTIEALERQGALLTRTLGIFIPLTSSHTSPEMDTIYNQLQPKLTELENDISLDPLLFERVRKVYEARHTASYDAEQAMLLEKTYKGFARNGAALSDSDKEIYRALTSELASLMLRFRQNVLTETNAYALDIPLADSARIAELPDFVKNGMAAEARERGHDGWTVTLHAPSITPFLTYSSDRELKERIWRKKNSLCNNDSETGNTTIVKRITELRLRLANLLGYATYADYVLEERMASSRSVVDSFLEELRTSTREWALDDFRMVNRYADSLTGTKFELMPWDFGYFSERLKSERYDMRQEEVKPYFSLERVERGLFLLAERLFGVTFKQNPAIQLYHPDVKAYEVWDGARFLGVLYMDYFPRASKREGAWMTNFQNMYTTADGTEVRPFVTLNFNFTKPTAEEPSLLTFEEVETALHEFGHGLHGIFAEGRYASLTGTEVYRDFVELPSQLLENWATEKEFLDLWAEHYVTGEKIPKELIDKIVRSQEYLSAYIHMRQLSLGQSDMAWHSITAPVGVSVEQFETAAMAPTQILPRVAGTTTAATFTHIFGGGYAAGYYSYKWSEVLEADAFSLFKERGIFDREVARSYRDNILSRGGSEDPMDLYVRFRGHKPETRALIEKIGVGR